MSIQGTFNQGLALASGLLALNPDVQQRVKDRADIKTQIDIIDNREQLAEELKKNHKYGEEFPVDVAETLVGEQADAYKKLSDIKPKLYGKDYVEFFKGKQDSINDLENARGKKVSVSQAQDGTYVLNEIKDSDQYGYDSSSDYDSDVFFSLQNQTQSKRSIQQGLDEREKLLRSKASLRQQMKSEGYKPKEIRKAYSDKKRGDK